MQGVYNGLQKMGKTAEQNLAFIIVFEKLVTDKLILSLKAQRCK
jgi:hypothetical protein